MFCGFTKKKFLNSKSSRVPEKNELDTFKSLRYQNTPSTVITLCRSLSLFSKFSPPPFPTPTSVTPPGGHHVQLCTGSTSEQRSNRVHVRSGRCRWLCDGHLSHQQDHVSTIALGRGRFWCHETG